MWGGGGNLGLDVSWRWAFVRQGMWFWSWIRWWRGEKMRVWSLWVESREVVQFQSSCGEPHIPLAWACSRWNAAMVPKPDWEWKIQRWGWSTLSSVATATMGGIDGWTTSTGSAGSLPPFPGVRLRSCVPRKLSPEPGFEVLVKFFQVVFPLKTNEWRAGKSPNF